MKKILFPGLWFLAVLGMLEVASGWWLAEHGNFYDRARAFVRADAELGWRQWPNVHTTFEGHPLNTNSLGWRAPELSTLPGTAKVRLLVLGPASTFGWGVASEQTYAFEIARLLRAQGAEAAVINAGEIGFSTVQGLKLLRSPAVAAFHPTHVLVAYGIDDLGRDRIYFKSAEPDSRALALLRPRSAVDAYHFLARSSLLTVLARAFRDLRGESFHEPSVRVPGEEFAANLRAFAREARELGAATAFLATPVNLPRYTPQLPAIEAELTARFAQAIELFRRGDLSNARLLFEELAKLRPQWNEPYHYLVAIARANGQGNARAYEDRALLSEPYRIHRDVLAYNALMRAAARDSGATFVDLYTELSGEKAAALFAGPVYPSARGHALIAAAVLRNFLRTGEAARRR